jgi:hypothetical protein
MATPLAAEDDDLDWDEWMKMSDAQHDAILDREMKAYNEWFDRLPQDEQIRHCVRRCLQNCVGARRNLKTFPIDFMRKMLKQSQMRLLKLRAWRQTGIYPGQG